MRRLLLIGLAACLPLVVAAPAAAEPPVMFTESITATTPSPNVRCTTYGYAFNTLATFTVERRYVQFYDGSTLVKEIRHIDFDGTLYRSGDLAKTIPYSGKWTRTWYPLEDLVVNTGLFRYSHENGSGMIVLDAGRTVQRGTPPFTIFSDTGPTLPEWEAGVCAYLAAA